MSHNSEGFTLVEVVIAVVLISIILTSLAGLTYTTARQAVAADNATVRQAIALQTVNRFATLPYASIPAAATPACDTVGVPNRQFRRCVNLSSGTNTTIIQVVTTPLQHNVAASTLRLIRAAPPSSNPLCMGC